MTRRVVAPAVAGVMLLCAPGASRADPFEDCSHACRDAYEANIRICAGGRRPEIVRACHERASQTRMRCMNQCTARENARLRLLQAREREAAERRRLRGQTEPPPTPR